MSDDLVFITGEEIEKVHNDLVTATGGLQGVLKQGNIDYIAETAPYFHEREGLCGVSAHFLSRIIKGHPFNDGNKRTGYFAARYFLMRNGADFNGISFSQAADEITAIASQPTMDSAYALAKNLCERDILRDQHQIPDYRTFYRLVIKSIGVASKLSKM